MTPVKFVHGDDGPARDGASKEVPQQAPMTAALASDRVPVAPEEKVVAALPLAPAVAAVSTAPDAGRPDHSMAMAAAAVTVPENVTLTLVWLPVQPASVHASQSRSADPAVFDSPFAWVNVSPVVPSATEETVRTLLPSEPAQTGRQFPAVVPAPRVTVTVLPDVAEVRGVLDEQGHRRAPLPARPGFHVALAAVDGDV